MSKCNDEILKYHAELKIEKSISLRKCCGDVPKPMFRSYREYFVECPKCKARTKYHKRLYEAMQAWNLQKIKEISHEHRKSKSNI